MEHTCAQNSAAGFIRSSDVAGGSRQGWVRKGHTPVQEFSETISSLQTRPEPVRKFD
jgi:hypothetical protein